MTQRSHRFQETSRPTPPTPQEQQHIDNLTAIIPDISPETALSVLRRNNGNLDKAASALLDPPEDQGTFPLLSQPEINVSGPRTPPPSKPERGSPIIDLTNEDDPELSRALQASMEDQGPHFGPSTRAPDPNWAVVPSNVPVNTTVSHDDQSLSRAIEASLTYNQTADSYDELPLEERVRKGNCPVALRPTQSSLVYAALLLHALYFVPQVRHSVANFRVDESDLEDGVMPDNIHLVWSVLEAFVNMDIALLTELNVDQILEAFLTDHWSNAAETPGNLSIRFYTKLAWTIESTLRGFTSSALIGDHVNRLFQFRYGLRDCNPKINPFDQLQDTCAVKVDIRGTPEANDLLSCLSSDLFLDGGASNGRQQVIYESSDVVAFHLVRENMPSSTGAKTERHLFGFPEHLYLDQFLKDNAELASQKRNQQRDLHTRIQNLVKKREGLTSLNGRDVLQDLRSSLHYYEHVAEHNDDANRRSEILSTATRLRRILARIESEIQTIDTTIAKFQADAAKTFDCKELQSHRYDLRVVLVHDGLYGRNHLYSYVKQNGEWWKTVDYTVTKVPLEAVLSDAVGLHLNAGPFFLIYSRALSPEEENEKPSWPDTLKNSVKHNNHTFLSSLSPEVAQKVADPNSPPTTPYRAGTPSEMESVSSSIVEPPGSRQDTMDDAP